MRNGWISIEEFKEWEEGRGVIHAVLNFSKNLEDYKELHRASADPKHSLSIPSFCDYIMRKFPDLGEISFVESYCDEIYSELSSLSKLSSLEWLCIRAAREFLARLPEYNINFNTFYQTYSTIVACVKGNNLRAIGMRQVNAIVERLLELPLYTVSVFDEDVKRKILNTVTETLSHIKAMRSLEFTSFKDLNSIAPDSFSSYYFVMQYMFQRIVIANGPGGILYRRTPLQDPEHLQNSMVKVWRIIYSNESLHNEVHNLFIDISRQGRGPVAADVVLTPIGAILAYFVVQALEMKEGSICIPTDMDCEKSYLQDLYFRLSIRLDRYNLSISQLEEIVDEELNSNNDIVTKDLLDRLNSISDCHYKVRRSMFNRDDQTLVRALIVGDSVSAGLGVNEVISSDSADLEYVYPKRTAAMITNHAIDSLVIANASLVGSVTSDGVRNIRTMLDVHKPHIVVLTQGGNDTILAGLNISGSAAAQANTLLTNIRKNFEKMIRECMRKNPDIVIILSIKIPESGFFLLHKEVNAGLLSKVLQPLKDKFPENVQLTDLPVEPFAFDDTMRLPDKIHLTSRANEILAEHMIYTLGAIREQMKIRSISEISMNPTAMYEAKCSRLIGDVESETMRMVCGSEDVRMTDVMEEIEFGVAPVVSEDCIDPYGLAILKSLKRNCVARRCRM